MEKTIKSALTCVRAAHTNTQGERDLPQFLVCHQNLTLRELVIITKENSMHT